MDSLKEATIDKLVKKRFTKVGPGTPIKRIIKIFDRTGFNVIPVISGSKFLGEIHKVDLLKLLVDMKQVPEEDIVSLGFGMDFGYVAKKAEHIMRRHEVSLSPDTKVKDAAYTMLKEGVTTIPVMEKKRIIGIVSEMEILEKLMKGGRK
jgi:predicted transcriptional regulator